LICFAVDHLPFREFDQWWCIRILGHTMNADPELFIEDALSEADALSASERFLVQSTPKGLFVRLYPNPEDAGVPLVSLDRVQAFIGDRLNEGVAVHVGGAL
jgi:hypothetical protein